MASRQQSKAMNGLLRQGLARDAAGVKECPEAEVLAAYYERSLDPEETARWESHFSQCAPCRQQLAAMVRADEPAAEPASRARSWFSNPWMLVPAVAAALTILIWLRVSPIMRSRQTESAEVAKAVQPAAPSVAPADTVARETSVPRNDSAQAEAKAERGSADPDSDLRSKKAAPSRDSHLQTKIATELPRNRIGVGVPVQEAPGVVMAPQQTEDRRAESAAPARVTSAAPTAAPAPSQQANGMVGGAAGPVPQQPQGRAQANGVQKNQIQQQYADNSVLIEDHAAKEDADAKQKVPAALAATGERTVAKVAASRIRTADERSTIIHSPDAKVLWRIASPSFVEFSQDGGATWDGEEVDPNVQLVAGASPSRNVCWLVGNGGAVFVTRDARTWKKVTPPASLDLVLVSARNDHSATVTSFDGRSFRTNDGGATWRPAK